jgi:hypothetical protein
MKKLLAVCCLTIGFTAFADTAPAGGAPDMSKMGPSSRKPTDEKKTKKEIDEMFKKAEEAHMKGDMEAMAALHDFPVFMATDDAKGAVETKSYSKEEFIAMMKPFFENMPKDTKTTHKSVVVVLSDSLANVTDDFTMTMGKTKMTGKNSGLLVKVDGNWKWKVMVEAGWGGMAPPADTKTAAAAKPADKPAEKPAPAAAPAPAPAKK